MAYSAIARIGAAIAVTLGYSGLVHAERSPALSTTAAVAEDSVSFAMLEARVHISDAWLLSVAAAYLDPGASDDETQLRLSATGALTIGNWSFDNRHLVSFSSASVERYRMRIRAIHPGLFGIRRLSLRAFDETFFDFDSRRLFRNNIAVGCGIQVTEALSGELYQVWELNRGRDPNGYALALLTFRFGAQR